MWIVNHPRELIEPVPAQIITVDTPAGIAVCNGMVSSYFALRRESLLQPQGELALEVVLRYPTAAVMTLNYQNAALIDFMFGRPREESADAPTPPRGWTPKIVG